MVCHLMQIQHRLHLPQDDPRPEIWLAGDESGTLDTTGRPEDWVFLVATAVLPACDLDGAMDLLRAAVGLATNATAQRSHFHASEDTPKTRDQLAQLLVEHHARFDVSYVDKRTLPTDLKPKLLYASLWYEHLVHLLPGVLLPDRCVFMEIAQLEDKSRQDRFAQAYTEATIVAYVPFMYWASTQMVAAAILPSRYLGPALLFGVHPARESRMLQAADLVAWSARRYLVLDDNRYYGVLAPNVTSFRELQLYPCKHDNLARYQLSAWPVKQVQSEIHRYHAHASYRIGPHDSMQALVALQQEVNLAHFETAAEWLNRIHPRELEAWGYGGLPDLVRTIVS
jgi:hypothetical protein